MEELSNTEFIEKLIENKHIFYEIFEACGQKFMHGCGSYLFDGSNYEYYNLMYPKQELLFNTAKSATRVLEIGTYIGHSLLIMLMANTELKITCVDISDEYARPAIKVLNRYFNNRVTFMHMDSLSALKILVDSNEHFDFFHIDGDHVNEVITKEFLLCKHLSPKIMNIIFDDQGNMTTLQNNIEKEYNILLKIIPDCPWSNLFYQIQL
jgi:hypothetical protein